MESAKDDFMCDAGLKTTDGWRKVTDTGMYRDSMSKVSVIVTFLLGWHVYGKVPAINILKKATHNAWLIHSMLHPLFMLLIWRSLSLFIPSCYKSFTPT